MANPSRLSAALSDWDRRVSNRAEDLAALGSELAAAAREALMAGSAAPVDFNAFPVHFVSALPRGRIFMHPDSWKSGERDPWPPPMPAIKDSLKTAFSLDGDGRDGFNGTGPFEG